MSYKNISIINYDIKNIDFYVVLRSIITIF